MTKIIPKKDLEKYIQSTGWTPGQKAPVRKPVNESKKAQPVQQIILSIDALINNGREFESSEQKDGKNIGISVALQQALNEIGDDGVVATMPYLIAGKSKANKNNYLWKKWFSAFSEENAGIDTQGKLVKPGKQVIITVHGGGILTPERIMKAYADGLTAQNSAKYSEEEFGNLLNGVLPSGESIDLYSVDDVQSGRISDSFGRYAVWMNAETAKATESGYHKKIDFMKNPLVMARVGTLEHLEAYFEKAKHSTDKDVRNSHRLGEIDFQQPQGRVLFLYDNINGLYGNNSLNYNGRFVGVAPKARGARK